MISICNLWATCLSSLRVMPGGGRRIPDGMDFSFFFASLWYLKAATDTEPVVTIPTRLMPRTVNAGKGIPSINNKCILQKSFVLFKWRDEIETKKTKNYYHFYLVTFQLLLFILQKLLTILILLIWQKLRLSLFVLLFIIDKQTYTLTVRVRVRFVLFFLTVTFSLAHLDGVRVRRASY